MTDAEPEPVDSEIGEPPEEALGCPVAPPDEVPTVVVQPKARAKRQPRSAAPPPPEPEPKPAPKRAKAQARGPRDSTGRFLKAADADAPNAPPKEVLKEVPRESRQRLFETEESESAFASLARALHGARQRDLQSRQQLYHGFVHG